MMAMLYDIEKIYSYHKPSGEQTEKYEALRNKARELAVLMGEAVPECRELSLARTKLEEAVMWTNAGIARGE